MFGGCNVDYEPDQQANEEAAPCANTKAAKAQTEKRQTTRLHGNCTTADNRKKEVHYHVYQENC
jgi:hypothetical protein